ncbi:hypothetical protein FRC00_010238 [Tulasnella sp. 408]|nr:hypothetical protein FRC00_010238 [Tulasnella sp. 408]
MEATEILPARKLVATLPSFNFKYQETLEHFADEAPLPNDWVEYLHPEGNTYYYHRKRGIVSNTDPRRTGAGTVLGNAFEAIQSKLPQEARSGNFEIYLNILDASRLGSEGAVEYYLVDYKSSTGVLPQETTNRRIAIEEAGRLVFGLVFVEVVASIDTVYRTRELTVFRVSTRI